MATITVGQLQALIDDEDVSLLSLYKWYPSKNVYTTYATTSVQHRTIYMHRLLLGCSDRTVHVDHINHDGLDNRRSNLRRATSSQNHGNMRKAASGRALFKGVTRDGRYWKAQIQVAGRNHHIGRYPTQAEAGAAYYDAARQHFGEFAYSNYCPSSESWPT